MSEESNGDVELVNRDSSVIFHPNNNNNSRTPNRMNPRSESINIDHLAESEASSIDDSVRIQILDSQATNNQEDEESLDNEEEKFDRFDELPRIDFVLVYRERAASSHASNGNSSPKNRPSSKNSHNEKRESAEAVRHVYEANLKKEGLQLLHVNSTLENDYRYVHVYASWDVLARYAEVMALRMPMKTIQSNLKLLFDEETNKESKTFTTVFSREKLYLFDIQQYGNREDFFHPSQRAEIVDFILRRTKFRENNDVFSIGINKLIADGVYEAAYPLHDVGNECPECESSDSKCRHVRCSLISDWGRVVKIAGFQPLDRICRYFGVKISMYYAWIGFYTHMLVWPALFGIATILYGYITMEKHQPIKDICGYNDTYWMCPTCAVKCNYTRVSESCTEAKVSWLFGNLFTLFFAVFISIWATLFLELWKRYSAEISHKWDLSNFNTIEEYPRPEFLARLSQGKMKTKPNPITRIAEPYISFKGRIPYFIISTSFVVLCIAMALLIMVSVIAYRVSVQIALWTTSDSSFLRQYGDILIISTAAFINLALILLLSILYKKLAYSLTELEMPRTQTEFDNSLTLKMFLFEFVNYYSSIFYIAFFKGRLQQDPPDGGLRERSNYLIESCPIGGCYLDLSLQLAIIFLGKNLMGTCLEYLWPYLASVKKRREYLKQQEKNVDKNTQQNIDLKQWEEDFLLESWDHTSLFYEYLEMVIQYGFVTIFVTAFPLAPLIALINNIFEIRLDARKMLRNYKRPVAQRVKDIGIWYNILDGIGRFSVFTNSVIIAFTTDFVPQMLHYFKHQNMNGYFDSTMSVYKVHPDDPQFVKTEYCVYNGYRQPPWETGHEYEHTQNYWSVLVARLLFVIVFQNVVSAASSMLKTLIPDVPRKLRLQKRQHAYLTNELIIRHELKSRKGRCSTPSSRKSKDSKQS